MKNLIKAFCEVKKLHADVYGIISEERIIIESCKDMELLADKAYALREINRLSDDLRKEAHALMELASKIACILWVNQSDGDPIRTALCTATPRLSQGASIPKKHKDPDAYYALMTYLNVPQEHAEKETVRVHWPSFVKLLTEKAEKGEPLPNGIDADKVYTQYALQIRAKQPLDEVEE